MEIKLKECRLERNLTIRELSNKSGVSIGEISDIENKIHIPILITYCNLARALGINVENELLKCD